MIVKFSEITVIGADNLLEDSLLEDIEQEDWWLAFSVSETI